MFLRKPRAMTFLHRSLLRPKDRINLSLQYLAGFSLTILFGYAEARALDSDVLMRQLKFILDNQILFTLAYSVVVVVWHYKFQVKSRKEIKYRIVVGDRLLRIRLRYATECGMVLALCAAVVFALAMQMEAAISMCNAALLSAVLAFYLFASACLLEAR